MGFIGKYNINNAKSRFWNEFNVTESDLIGYVKGMPLDLFVLILRRIKQQSWAYNDDDKSIIHTAQTVRIDSLFRFMDTDEGSEFWHNIVQGNYNVFYKLYPHGID